MRILKVEVKPRVNGKSEVRVFARDDAGNLLQSVASVPVGVDASSVAREAIKSLTVVAAEVTEEEN